MADFLFASNTMKRLIAFLLFVLAANTSAHAQSVDTTKPWAYWWQMGNALDSANISLQLRAYQQAGLGGVHIIPIYGAKGYESKFTSFMSEQWLNYLRFTCQEAKSLGLGVDLTLGTGWPYGGPTIGAAESAKKISWQGDTLVGVPTKQKVKRAAPGGDGWVIDYFDQGAFGHYTRSMRFEQLKSVGVRAIYHDSYEAFDANWTSDFMQKFKAKRGYSPATLLHFLKPNFQSDSAKRFRYDYRATMSELLLGEFTQPLQDFAKRIGTKVRNQAHGSPANLIDLYAAVDIPETESFGSSRFNIPLVRVDADYQPEQFGRPNVLAMKFASSAAHLTGKKLVSSETGTWLANHFKVSLSQIKPQIDELFVGGINHVFYHGITYTPKEEAYPGWLFYASTNFGIHSHLWPDLPHLNRYISACQQLLQTSQPDNELLLYFPISDLWSDTGNPKLASYPLQMLEVHHTDKWLLPSSFGQTALQLTQMGYQYDFVSDQLLKNLTVNNKGLLVSQGQTYKALVLPPCEHIPLETAQRLLYLQKQQANIIFLGNIPQKVGGLANFTEQERQLKQVQSELGRLSNASLLQQIPTEPFAQAGLAFVRKRNTQGYLYFVSNLDSLYQKPRKLQLGVQPKYVELYYPVSGQRQILTYENELVLPLAPGESVFIQTLSQKPPQRLNAPPNIMRAQYPLQSTWQLQIQSRPVVSLSQLQDWCTLPDSSFRYFSGVGVYTSTFELDADYTEWQYLDLGDVRETAEVSINGQPIGTAWCVPYKLKIPAGLLARKNTLEVRVRNLSANEMIKIDQKRPEWKHFYDINVVDIRYKPLHIATWKPEVSGLLGPVKLLR